MTLLTPHDLQYQYSWQALSPDDPLIRGSIDARFLNRGEGYEVLYFLNALAAHNGWTDRAPALKAERLIHNYLPGSVRGRSYIHQWLYDNWNSFQ